MRVIVSIVVAVIMVIIANKKGFNPWLWVLAGGVPGFLILLFLPSANAEGLDEETVNHRRKVGNNTGGIITVIAIILIIVIISLLSSL